MALWRQDEAGWALLSPSDFPKEADLHDLVADAPHMLPLSGEPRLTVVGREVALGGGYADLIAVESSGRLAIVEVKLARNAEARRAVVAQILAYAAFLHGLDRDQLERDVLARQLRQHGHATVADAVSAGDQEGDFELEVFERGLNDCLRTGEFRLVLVLDAAPPELVRLVGYLEAIGGAVVIDLVSVSAYEVEGSRVIVPQRVEPERVLGQPRRGAGDSSRSSGYLVDGADDFEASIEHAATEHRAHLIKLVRWARQLEAEGLVWLRTYHGKGRLTLLPRLVADDAGLVTIWNDSGAYISLWRTVFERRAPESIEPVETLLSTRIGTGNVVRDLRDEVLNALTLAYREAAAQASR